VKGVSEVLGEALLMIVVVLLSAALAVEAGSWISGIKERPVADFLLISRGKNYTIVHEEGDPIPISELRITVYNSSGFYAVNASKLIEDSNKNGMWDFGECLNVSKGFGRAVITIAAGRFVLCRLYT